MWLIDWLKFFGPGFAVWLINQLQSLYLYELFALLVAIGYVAFRRARPAIIRKLLYEKYIDHDKQAFERIEDVLSEEGRKAIQNTFFLFDGYSLEENLKLIRLSREIKLEDNQFAISSIRKSANRFASEIDSFREFKRQNFEPTGDPRDPRVLYSPFPHNNLTLLDNKSDMLKFTQITLEKSAGYFHKVNSSYSEFRRQVRNHLAI